MENEIESANFGTIRYFKFAEAIDFDAMLNLFTRLFRQIIASANFPESRFKQLNYRTKKRIIKFRPTNVFPLHTIILALDFHPDDFTNALKYLDPIDILLLMQYDYPLIDKFIPEIANLIFKSYGEKHKFLDLFFQIRKVRDIEPSIRFIVKNNMQYHLLDSLRDMIAYFRMCGDLIPVIQQYEDSVADDYLDY